VHEGDVVTAEGEIMHSLSARALSRPQPLLHCPRALIKSGNAYTTGI